MEQRITSLLLPAPEAELEASCKELDEKVTWLLHNSRKMDNYLELGRKLPGRTTIHHQYQNSSIKPDIRPIFLPQTSPLKYR